MKTFYLYGAGDLGQLAVEVLSKLNLPYCLLDSYKKGILRPDDIQESERESSCIAICIATSPYRKIEKTLSKKGWKYIISIYDIFLSYPECKIKNGWFVGEMWKDEVLKIKEVHERWEDKASCLRYSSFLMWRLYKKESNISLNIGLPILPSTLTDIEKRRKVITYADAPMDNISIHAEGCELETINRNIHLFQKYRPTINVACYHTGDGLWEIEKTLMDGLERYKWYFQLYAYQAQGAYIYGVPK